MTRFSYSLSSCKVRRWLPTQFIWEENVFRFGTSWCLATLLIKTSQERNSSSMDLILLGLPSRDKFSTVSVPINWQSKNLEVMHPLNRANASHGKTRWQSSSKVPVYSFWSKEVYFRRTSHVPIQDLQVKNWYVLVSVIRQSKKC